MSKGLLDKEGWMNAIGPSVKVIGYTASIYLVSYVVLIVPSTLLVQYLGAPDSLLTFFISPLSIIIVLFGFVASIFKVIDEERPGRIQMKMA